MPYMTISDGEKGGDNPLVASQSEEEEPLVAEPLRSPGRLTKVLVPMATLALGAAGLHAWKRVSGSAAVVSEAGLDGVTSKADAESCEWSSKGRKTYCRLDPEDTSWDGADTTVHKWMLSNLNACKQECQNTEGCRGVEWHHGWSGHCELWMKPIGHYVEQDGGWMDGVHGEYECLQFTCMAKDACHAVPDHYCEASEGECHVIVPDAGSMPDLFPNNCGTPLAMDYVMHFHNDQGTEVTIEADTCDKDDTLFDTTISIFTPNGDDCEATTCNDDAGAACSSSTCHADGVHHVNQFCTPDLWIKCCSKASTQVPPDGQILIVVSSYHKNLVRFVEDKDPGFRMQVKVL